MEFIFFDKTKVEMEIITDILHENNITYKIRKKIIENVFFDEEDEDEDFYVIEEIYEIHCFTDLNHFDFVKTLAKKRIENRIKLEKCFSKKAKVRKIDVQTISKKNNRNTFKRDKSK